MMFKKLLNALVIFGFSVTLAAAPVDDFVTTWKTDELGTSNDTSIAIPTTGNGYNYDVDWDNDGIFDEFGIAGSVTHDFGVAGTHTIRIRGAFPRIYFSNAGDSAKILSVDQWGTGNWISMENAFWGAGNLTVPATDTPDFSQVTSMAFMFYNARLANPDTSAWDVSAVTDMSYMFATAYDFDSFFSMADPDTSAWDVSKVTNMRSMFDRGYSANPDTSAWDVSSVKYMSGMFRWATSANPQTSEWDVASVTDMSWMFFRASAANPNTSSWDVSSVTDMEGMFFSAVSAIPITRSWDVSAVTRMNRMFLLATLANPETGSWDVSAVTDMSEMFQNAQSANPDTSSWDVSSVTNMSEMFMNTDIANPETGSWIVSAVTDMRRMFYRAYLANPDTSTWNVSSVTDMSQMFYDAGSANPDTSGWDVSRVTSMYQIFMSAVAANPNTGSWDVSSVIDMRDMFLFADVADPDTSNWDVSNVIDMARMFWHAGSANPDVSNWDVSAVRIMRELFYYASSADPDVRNWDVSSVTSLGDTFLGSNLSTRNYDALLINWSTQALPANIWFRVGNTVYCSPEAQAARANIRNTHNWSFNDGGPCATPPNGWNVLVNDFEGFKDCPDCPLMIEIQGGAFSMGDLSGAGTAAELPAHSVTVTGYAIGVQEVTFDQWDACVAATACAHSPDDANFGRGQRPVINVSWDDIQEYLLWLGNITGKSYRLPSESEWEYAARARTETTYYLGNTIVCMQARYVETGNLCGSSGTLPVGSYSTNSFGLHDMHGNVSEWVQDCWNDSYDGAPTDGSAWLTGALGCSERVWRSGSWNDGPIVLRSSNRNRLDKMTRTSSLGFRVVTD